MEDLSKSEKSNKYPRLFHIGTQKAASTFLFNALKEHPNIALSSVTEINFFSQHFEKDLSWYDDTFLKANNRIDTSPKYFMLGESVAPRIREYQDKHLGQKAKFLLILRNPIDYLASHFEMQKQQGFFKNHPDKYPAAPKSLIDHIKNYPDYIDRAFYFKIFNNYWLKEFDKSQFKLVIFEEFINNKEEQIKEILSFFELPIIELHAKSASSNKLLKYDFLFRLRMKIAKNEGLKNYLKNSKLFNRVYNKFLTKSSSKMLSSSDREYLQGILHQDVKDLELFLSRKIEAWKDFK